MRNVLLTHRVPDTVSPHYELNTAFIKKTVIGQQWKVYSVLTKALAVLFCLCMLFKTGVAQDTHQPGSAKTDTVLNKNEEQTQLVYEKLPSKLTSASTGKVNSVDIVKYPVTSFRNTLTGRLAGLYTIQSTGLPGADGASLMLRGQSPIFVVDGVVTSLTTFDLESIESVTVLKDAMAAAMLGVRGSQGAIIITTKKGRPEKQQISFTAQSSIQQSISWPKTVNAYDYAFLHNEALRNDGIDSAYSGLYYSQNALNAYRDGSDPMNYPNVNYREAITKDKSQFKRYTLSATGGNSFARYFISLDHMNQSGFFKTVDSNKYNTNNSFKSYMVRSNIDLNITPKLTSGVYLFGRILNADEPGATTNTLLSNLINTPANAYPLLNADNSFGGNQLYQNNLLAQTVSSGYRQRYSRDILLNIYLKRTLDEIIRGLWVKVKVAYSSTLNEDVNRSKTFAVFQYSGPTYNQYGTDGTQSNNNGISLQGRTDYQEISVGYDRDVKKNNVSAIILANRDNLFNGTQLPYTLTGVSGRVAYNFKSKYLIEGAFGYNGSNRYPEQGATKRGFLPSIGVGWNLDQEDFIKSLSFVSQLKIYSSYGKSGWDNPGYFVYYPRFFDGPAAVFGTGAGAVTTVTEGTLPNKNITWEKAHKFNAGIKGSLLNHKLSFTGEYFINKYYDLLQQRGANSDLIGNNYPDENIGENKYFGWEAQLGWQQTIEKLQFFIQLNLTSLNSKVLFMDEVSRPFDWMKRTGQPVGQLFGYISEGLFQTQAEINNSPATVGYSPQPGDIKFKDLNDDGLINQFDQTGIRTTKPLLFGGISFGVSFKGFDFSALIQGVKNREIYASGNTYWAFANGTGQAYSHNLERWTVLTGSTATYPRLSYGDNINNNAVSSFWIRNGNYIRLKNMEVGYSLPASLIGRIRLQTVRIFANGYNLLTKKSSELDGRDPEAFGSIYPIQRLFNFGINLKF